MRLKLTGLALTCCMALGFIACQDDTSTIGGSLAPGEVTITVDSIETDLRGKAEWINDFDSRTTTKLLGNLTIPEYGNLKCSFVTQMMSSTKMNIPDSIPESDVDSIRMVMSIPRGALTGDSLAPQQLRVYRLEKALPKDIDSRFDPTGYYDPSAPFATKSYTVSNISKNDTIFAQAAYVNIPMQLPLEFGRELFRKYRDNDPIFEWPATFNQWFQGIYVEQNFGNGCVANIASVRSYLYWHRKEREAVTVDSAKVEYRDVIRRDSVCLLASAPEVLSSNNINYSPSAQLQKLAEEGKSLVTSPGGYVTTFRFPVRQLLDRYLEADTELSVISSLVLKIPAVSVKNDYGMTPPNNLLMTTLDQREEFFRENKIPDNVTSFYCTYDSENKIYTFSSMREYLLKKLDEYRKDPANFSDDEVFCLQPIAVTTEKSTNNYYGQQTTYVTRVAPYLATPTMVELDMEHAQILFTFSSQVLE